MCRGMSIDEVNTAFDYMYARLNIQACINCHASMFAVATKTVLRLGATVLGAVFLESIVLRWLVDLIWLS